MQSYQVETWKASSRRFSEETIEIEAESKEEARAIALTEINSTTEEGKFEGRKYIGFGIGRVLDSSECVQ